MSDRSRPRVSRRSMLLVLGLFILGVAGMSLLGERSAERTAVSGVVEAGSGKPAKDRRKVPDIRFEDAQGKPRSLADFSGRHVLLNVWATWCTPCRKEMPSLDALQRALSDRRFDVLALSIDKEGVPAVERFYGELGLRSLAIYVDTTSAVLATFGIAGIPTSVMIDPAGAEMWRISGPVVWDDPEVIARLRRDTAQR